MKGAYLILGLGRATRAIVHFLLKRGGVVFGYDKDWEKGKEFIKKKNFTFISQEEISSLDKDLIIITSPGIAEDSEVSKLARKQGEIISDIEFVYQYLYSRQAPHPIIVAITGTNGKSTTTALLGSILRKAGKKVFWGGNIAPGKPAARALNEKKEIFVFEVSSFQLEKIKDFKPNLSILLNISPDHLDRYRNLEEYISAKANIFSNQTETDLAILNYDDPRVRVLKNKIRARVFYFSCKSEVFGAYLQNGVIYTKEGKKGKRLLSLAEIKINHHLHIENTLAASLAATILGVKPREIKEGIKEFPGLPHRLEKVISLSGVDYINNSMATNPAALVNSLRRFKKPVILIAGGQNKGFPLKEYVKPIKERCKYTILIGDVRKRLYEEFSPDERKKVYCADSLREAVLKASEIAKRNDIVLFSPGFASFDMFKNFMARGEAFKRIVGSLR